MNLTNLKIELTLDEGLRYTVYLDSRGIPTTGIGHNCNASPLPAGWGPTLTDDQVNTLFQSDVMAAMNELDTNAFWWAAMDEVRQRAYLNLCFNMGWGTLATFNTFNGLMEAAHYSAAAADLATTKWYGQVGSRGPRIVQMIATGVSPYPGVNG